MKTITILAVLLAIGAGAILAQCIPDPTLSSCNLYVVKNDLCPASLPKHLVWCPAGDMSYFELEVYVDDGTGSPCAFTDIRVIIRMGGTPAVPGNDLYGCGFNAAGERFYSLTTDVNGKAYAQFWGGGCGCLFVGYTVESITGVTICGGQDNFCVKSPDMNGDGIVQFLDTFQFLPCLGTSFSPCCDFNCDGTVTFIDTFQFLPHLSGGHQCVGSTLPIIPCLTPPICF